MGATERMRLWFPNINVVMVARIRGRITKRDLERGVTKARQKHPLLGARIELDGDGAGWFTTQGVPEIPIEVVPRATGSEWRERVNEELKRRWPIGIGPLCHFVLFHGPNASDLVVNAHHSICDAHSLAYLIRDILAFAGTSTDVPEPEPVIPVSLEEAVSSHASGGFLSSLVMRGLNRKWLRKGITFDETDYRGLHRSFWKERCATVLSWTLSTPQVKALVHRCRKRRISVNSALYLAFLEAQHRVQGVGRSVFNNVLVPVSLRSYLAQRVAEALGLYASVLQLRFKVPPDKPFWHSAQMLDARVKRQLTDRNIFAAQRLRAMHPSLLDGLAFARFGGFDDPMARGLVERVLTRMRTGILVSNLGRLDLPADYGGLRLSAIRPPAIYAGNAEKALEVLTFGGRMFLTLTFDAAVVARETVQAVVDTAMGLLAASSSW